MMFYRLNLILFCWGLTVGHNDANGQQQVNATAKDAMTISIPYKGNHYVGKPLAWDGKELLLLRRDGKLNMLPVSNENDYQVVSQGFKPYNSNTLRQQLQAEFGGHYQVSVTQHFVVVHPSGDFQIWALPFEKLYQRFRLYFSSRGMNLTQPEFPMVAVVLRTRQEFDRFLERYHQLDEKILGYYSPKSNRVITYDQRPGKSNDQNWFFHTDTVIHEATHQSAFNTGLHSRFAPVPRWTSEGLAMLFEANGVNNSALYTTRSSRINQARLRDLKHFYQQGMVEGRLAELVSSDDLFRTDPLLAYALSWGLTFYLTEHRQQEYFRFLRDDSQRTDFTDYPSHERVEAFGKAFGVRLADLEGRMRKFILSLE
jgi:hypothetical protein